MLVDEVEAPVIFNDRSQVDQEFIVGRGASQAVPALPKLHLCDPIGVEPVKDAGEKGIAFVGKLRMF